MTMSSSPGSTILLKPFVNDIISCFPKSLGIHPNHAFSDNVNSSLTAPDEHQVDHCIFPGNWSWSIFGLNFARTLVMDYGTEEGSHDLPSRDDDEGV